MAPRRINGSRVKTCTSYTQASEMNAWWIMAISFLQGTARYGRGEGAKDAQVSRQRPLLSIEKIQIQKRDKKSNSGLISRHLNCRRGKSRGQDSRIHQKKVETIPLPFGDCKSPDELSSSSEYSPEQVCRNSERAFPAQNLSNNS